jgi:hypothetical protein
MQAAFGRISGAVPGRGAQKMNRSPLQLYGEIGVYSKEARVLCAPQEIAPGFAEQDTQRMGAYPFFPFFSYLPELSRAASFSLGFI